MIDRPLLFFFHHITIHLDGNIEIDDRRSVVSIASQIGVTSGLENSFLDTSLGHENQNLLTEMESNTVNSTSVANKTVNTQKAALESDLAQSKLYEAMDSVLNALKSHPVNYSTNTSSQPVKKLIITINNFAKIAARKMQILLYNLLDLARDGSVALCLIGITTFSDIDSLLEKRVKSRFASRKTITLDRNFNQVKHVLPFIKHVLNIDESEFLDYCQSGHPHTPLTYHDENGNSIKMTEKSIRNLTKTWNADVEKLLKSAKFSNFLKLFLIQFNSPQDIIKLLHLSLLTWTDTSLTPEHIIQTARLITDVGISDEAQQLSSLSTLQFISAISILKTSERNPDKGINFEMIFKEIMDCKLSLNCSRSLHIKAFQELIEMGLVLPIKGCKTSINYGVNNNSNEMFEYIKYHSMIDRQDLDAALKFLEKELPKDVIHKANISNKVLY